MVFSSITRSSSVQGGPSRDDKTKPEGEIATHQEGTDIP